MKRTTDGYYCELGIDHTEWQCEDSVDKNGYAMGNYGGCPRYSDQRPYGNGILIDTKCIHFDEYKTAVAALHKVRKSAPAWIPVKPHSNEYSKPDDGTLPLNTEDVLVVRGKQITIGVYDKSCWYYLNQDKMKYEMDMYNQVTHWMPLPKLPE